MNGVSIPQDDGYKSSVQMGLSSILTVLGSIETEVGDIATTLKKIVLPSTNNNTNISTTSLDNYVRLSYETLSSINLTLNDYFKKSGKLLSTVNTTKNNKSDAESVSGMLVENMYQFNFGDMKEKTFTKLTGVLKPLESILSKADKLKKVAEFFKDIKTTLTGMDTLLSSVGKGMMFLSLGIAALQYVSIVNVFKIIMILPLFALNLALFINIILKATSKVGGGIGGIFKFGMLMFAIKDIFSDIGKGVAIMAAGLLILNYVDWQSVMKLGVMFSFIGLLFHILKASEIAEWSLIFSIGIMLITMTVALKKMENVEWDSVLQLPMFILLLGQAFVYGRFNKRIRFINALSIGLILITGALFSFKYIEWSNVLKYPLFIALLGKSMSTWKNNKDMALMVAIGTGLIQMAMGLGSMENIDVKTILYTIGVIATLGYVISKFFGNGNNKISFTNINNTGGKSGGSGFAIFGLSLGMLLLTHAFTAFEAISWTGVLKGLLVIGMLGLIMKIFFTNKVGMTNSLMGKGGGLRSMPPMLAFSIGIALLVLTLDAMTELDWLTIGKFLLFVGALGLIFKFLFPKQTRMSGMLGFGIGMSLIILSLDALTEIDWITVGKFVALIAGIGLVFKYLLGNTGTLKIVGFAVSIGILAFAMYQIGTKFNSGTFEGVLLFGLAVGIMGGIVYLLGKIPDTTLKNGLLAGLGIAAITWVMGKALKEMYIAGTLISENWWSLLGFAGGVLISTIVVGLIGAVVSNPIGATILLGGGIAVLGLAFVIGVMATSMRIITETKWNPETFENFGKSVAALVSGIADTSFFDLLVDIPKIMMLVPVLGVAWLAAHIMESISKTFTYDNNLPLRVKTFTKSISTLVNDFGADVDGWNVAKGALKTVPIMDILGTMHDAAKVIEKISTLEINAFKMVEFNQVFNNLIDSVLVTLSKNADKIRNTEPGIKAIRDLAGIAGGVAKMVDDIANLRFNEYAVRNGQLVLVGVKPMGEKDFARVGTSLGKLILALIRPLKVLGSDASTWSLGGVNISNPFKNSQMQNGIENVKRITEVFKPFTDSVKKISDIGLIDVRKSITFAQSLIQLSTGFKNFFHNMGLIDINKAKGVIMIINDYNSMWSNVDNTAFKEMNDLLNTFIDKFADQQKWNIIHRNMDKMVKNTGVMVKHINSLNVEKALLFERNLKQLTDKRNFEYLKQVVEQFANMFMIIQQNNQMMMGQYMNTVGEQTQAIQETTETIKNVFDPSSTNSLGASTTGVLSGKTISNKNIHEILGNMKDGNKNATIDISKVYDDEAAATLRKFDKDKSGVISYLELQQYIEKNDTVINMLLAMQRDAKNMY